MTQTNGLHPIAPASAKPPAMDERSKLLQSSAEAKQLTRTKHVGLVALCALVWSWVLQSEASQALQEVVQFDKPFFIVCFNHTMTAVVLPLVVGYYWVAGAPEDAVAVLKRHSVIPFDKLCWISACLSVFYLFADYFWYAALANVSVTAGTAIFNCSPLFVYCFSVCFLHERPSFGKICGVFTSFVGVTMVVMFQNGGDVSEIAGTSLVAGLLVVVSAALYGGYEVALRLAVGEDITDTATLLTLTGLCGLFTIPLWLVGSFALAYSPFASLQEPLGFPVTGDGVFLLLLSGVMAVVFNIFLPLSLCWTSPLETSVGVMLTIPLSGVIDTLMHNTSFSWQCIVGSALVMGGFGILEYCNGPPEVPHHQEPIESSGLLV
ncbi:putative vacuolar membrane protein [Phytophthora cinnamomi]|uniref:putative vacuolar membrane protein n=1 Tax=Phytophthora cinnamomi TaxID=4785 RepID=UPI00355ABA64|nr:putative vacuolar membrane protein [Phytophthora cinnamomi]